MIVSATVDYKVILDALGLSEIPGVDLEPFDEIELSRVDVDELDIDVECPMCGGDGPEDPPDAVNPNLIADFLTAVRDGDIHTAQALVGRVFETPDDVAIVDRGLCRCAA